jgi:hypothetical protein
VAYGKFIKSNTRRAKDLKSPLRRLEMTIRPLIAALAFVSLAAPLAARADAPAGDINTVFAVDQNAKVTFPAFDGHGYNPNVDELLAGPKYATSTVTREQVLQELAAMPQERIGA